MSPTPAKADTAVKKKPYTKPRVVVLGDLRTLTQSGSLTQTESMTMMMMRP